MLCEFDQSRHYINQRMVTLTLCVCVCVCGRENFFFLMMSRVFQLHCCLLIYAPLSLLLPEFVANLSVVDK